MRVNPAEQARGAAEAEAFDHQRAGADHVERVTALVADLSKNGVDTPEGSAALVELEQSTHDGTPQALFTLERILPLLPAEAVGVKQKQKQDRAEASIDPELIRLTNSNGVTSGPQSM